MDGSTSWFYWAVLSAVFAALTAIFANVGIQGVDPDLATLFRTAIIIIVLSAFVWFTGKWSNPLAFQDVDIPRPIWPSHWRILGVLLPSPSTWRRFEGGARGQAELGACRHICVFISW
jgi:transporter family protein